MNIPDIDPIAGNLQQQIEQAAQRSYDWLLELIAEGQDPRKATETVLRSFQGEYVTAMTEAFSAAMVANVTPGSVLAMPVGDVFLSERLYAHARQTGQEVAAIVRQHAQGLQQARALALSLYDGYNPRDGIKRPLEGVARAELPKALRELTSNPGPRQDLTLLLDQMQQQASRLKSEALKAGYMEALKAWGQGKGAEVLKQRLWVAEREKTRYMANRIAQTELARAYQDKVAGQIMDDDTITVVQVKLNPRHPLPDICDLHARADLWGLGPGLYPKAKAPKPPFHPHCWCRLVTRPDKTDELAREREDAVRQWLRTLPAAEAARILGNRQRLDYVLNGADWEKITQAAVREEYRLRRVGEVAASWPSKSRASSLQEIAEFMAGDAANPIPVAVVPTDIRQRLGASSEIVLLSRYTADKQRKHPEITAESFGWLQELLDGGERLYDQKHHATVIQHREEPYLAVLKATSDGSEVYLQSFRRTDAKNIASLKKRVNGS